LLMHQVQMDAISVVTPATQSIQKLVSKRGKFRLAAGWARRAKHGKGFGVRYMKKGPYMGMIRKMFRRGEKKKGEKMGPAQMLERIMKKHPKEYAVPSLEEVSQAVSKIAQDAKSGTAGEAGGRGRPALSAQFPAAIAALQVEFDRLDGALLPAAGVAWMTAAPSWAAAKAQGLTEAAVRRQISGWRRKRKAARQGVEDSDSDDDNDCQ
jgi:hypothetical protein